mgnify:CR=1 FL=1
MIDDRYRRALEALPQIVWMATASGDIVEFNARWTDYTGLSRQRVPQNSFWHVVHPDDRDRARSAWLAACRNGTSYEADVHLRHADGSYNRFVMRGEPVYADLSASDAEETGERSVADALGLVPGSAQPEAREIVEWVGTFTRARKLERIETELQNKQQFLEALLENLSEAIVACNEIGTIVQFNRAAHELHGLPDDRGALPDRRWTQNYHLYRGDGSPLPISEIPLYRALQGEVVSDMELSICPPGQMPRTAVASGVPVYSPGGERLGAVVAMRDITQRRQAEMRLRETRERYQMFVKRSSDLISSHTPDGIYLFASPASQALLGYEPDELIGRSIYDFFHPEDVATIARTFGDPELLPDSYSHTYRVRRKDATYRWFETTSQTIYNEDRSSVKEVVAISRDITERKQQEIEMLRLNQELERQLQEGEAQLETIDRLYRSVLCSVEEVIFQTDTTGRWTFLSSPWTLVTGYTIEQSLNNSLLDFVFSEDDRLELSDRLQRLLAGEMEFFEFEFRSPTCGGSFRWLEIHALPDRDRHGTVLGTSGSLRDITSRKQTEAILQARADELADQRRKIEQKNDALRKASQLKSEFLATMSHELRTPMNAIVGFSQMLKTYGDLEEKQRNMVERITTNSEHLLSMLNAVLDFSKIEAGYLELQLESFDLVRLVRLTVEELRSLAQARNLSLKVSLEVDRAPIVSDRGSLRRVLANLLGNAVKFTDRGGIEVEIQQADPDSYRVAVRDTGVGIAEADLETIFEAFRQLEHSLTRTHSGIGLGLAITQSIVRQLHGTIAVDSELGRGSTFCVTLPRDAWSDRPATRVGLDFSLSPGPSGTAIDTPTATDGDPGLG